MTGPGDLMWSMKKENRMTSLASQMVKNLPAMQETWVQSLCQEDPLEKGMANHACCFLFGESHGQSSLAGYNSWDHKELDITE